MEAINYFDMEQNAANVNILMVLGEQSIIFQKRDWILSNFLMPVFFFFPCKIPFYHSCILLDIHFVFAERAAFLWSIPPLLFSI